MNRLISNPANFYLGIWMLYNLKGVLYPEGSIINQFLMLIILVISAYETIVVLRQRGKGLDKSYSKGIIALIAMYTIYGILLFITDGTVVKSPLGEGQPSLYFFEAPFIVFLPIYTCFLYTNKGYLNLRVLQKWVPIFLIVGIAQYYKIQGEMMQRLIDDNSVFDEFTNNAGYIILSILPGIIVFRQRRLLMFIGLAICTGFILMSMKRGAIVIGALILIMYALYLLKANNGLYKILTVAGIVIGMFFLVNMIENLLENSDYFNYRLQMTLNGDDSARSEIYTNFIDTYLHNSSFFQCLFGRGAMGTYKFSGTYAHNDWIEFLFDHGILGVGFLILYWKNFLSIALSRKYSGDAHFVIMLIFIMYFARSLFSMSITSMPIYSSVMLGFALSNGFNTGLEKA